MSEKDVNLTMDTKVLVKQVLSTLPQMGNQINVINIQSVHQGSGGVVDERMFCFDLEFEKFFAMLPPPRMKGMIDFVHQTMLKKFGGNVYLAAKYEGVTPKTLYNFLKDKEGRSTKQPLQLENET